MKKILLILTLALAFKYTYAQQWQNVTNQYINNPSFEDYWSCPQGFSGPSAYWIDSCKYWYTPSYATPDYYNSCSTFSTSGIPIVGVPLNQFGFQKAFDGYAYCGFYAFSNYGDH